MNVDPQNTFLLHFSLATKGPADISVILSLTQVRRTKLEITLSC